MGVQKDKVYAENRLTLWSDDLLVYACSVSCHGHFFAGDLYDLTVNDYIWCDLVIFYTNGMICVTVSTGGTSAIQRAGFSDLDSYCCS